MLSPRGRDQCPVPSYLSWCRRVVDQGVGRRCRRRYPLLLTRTLIAKSAGLAKQKQAKAKSRDKGGKGKGGKSNARDGLPQPTTAHRCLVDLEKAGHVYWCASQNYDNLSKRSGFPPEKTSELHGNIYKEHCRDCGSVYFRDFEVELSTSTDHETGRTCEKCGGDLFDNIVHCEFMMPVSRT